MKKQLLALPLFVLIAGCAERMEITSAPVDVSRTSSFQSENYVGNHPVEVRSFAVSEAVNGKSETTEFSGANCKIQGAGYTAKFSTPAIVNFPDHGCGQHQKQYRCRWRSFGNGRGGCRQLNCYRGQ